MFGVQKKVIYLVILQQYNASHTYVFMANRYNARMDQNAELPNNLDACHLLLRQQLDVIAKFAANQFRSRCDSRSTVPCSDRHAQGDKYCNH